VVYSCDNYRDYLQEPAPAAVVSRAAPPGSSPRDPDATGNANEADGVDPRDVTLAAANSDAGASSGCALASRKAGH